MSTITLITIIIYSIIIKIYGQNKSINNNINKLKSIDQVDLLTLFFINTNGYNWFNNKNWLSDEPINTWYGISIDDSGNIIEISLSKNNLNGYIIEDLGYLVSLESLILDHNTLTGNIPNTLALLTKLSVLNIESNNIEGSIPDLYSSMSDFKAGNNLLSGTLPSSRIFRYIKGFQCYNNKLYGSFPFIGSYDMKLINIENNGFSGSLIQFNDINSVISIDASENIFSGVLTNSFGYTCSLTHFYYGKNVLYGSIPNNLGNCKNLEKLGLFDNQLSGSIPSTFANLASMLTFSLEINHLVGSISNDMISNMTKLENLYLYSNFFTGQLPTSLSNRMALKDVRLQLCSFEGTIPSLNSNVLYYLNAGMNYLEGSAPLISSYLLEYLLLYNNYLSSELSNYADNYKLLVLELFSNHFTGTISSSLASLTLLNTLYLQDNDFTGSLPLELCQLNLLRLLSIDNLYMCVPSCLYKAAYSYSSTNFVRCQSEQDIALCSFLNQTNVYYQLSSSLDYTFENYESVHPINPMNDTTFSNYVYIDGAASYILSFDDWTNIGEDSGLKENLLLICADVDCTEVLYSYTSFNIPGMNNNYPLEIQIDSFYITIQFESESNFEYWGYSVSVEAIFPLVGWKCTSPSSITVSYSEETLSQYNLSLNNSYAYNLCSDQYIWHGISCTFMFVTSLNLGSYGIAGIIPESLGLMTNLEQLYLSYNSLTGSIPNSIGNLANIQILDLSNNRLKNKLPVVISQLINLEYLYLGSNDLTGSIDQSFSYLNQSLKLMSLPANHLTGKLTNDICSLVNTSIDISGNYLICYESCWNDAYGKTLRAGDLSMCSPTNYPTSQPSSPTNNPTNYIRINNNNNNNNNTIYTNLAYVFATVVVIVGGLLTYRYTNSKDRKLKQIRRDILKKLPIHRYIIQNKPISDIIQIISHSPSTIMNCDYDGNNVIELTISKKLTNEVVVEILKQLLLSQFNENVLNHDFICAWTKIVQLDIYEDSVRHILDVYHALRQQLSDCLDENGRSAVNIASPLCRQAIKESLYFLRRYDLGSNCYPLHVSETSIVYLAIDTHADNENKQVVLKFLSDKDSYLNEIHSRIALSADADGIIEVIVSYDAHNNITYNTEIIRRKWDKYTYCIVMPAGEKNLGNIIASERIAGKDWQQLKVITTKLVVAISQLHSKQYIHGDIKPLNVLRKGNDIKLIDLDACAKVGTSYYGNKYSQAYVPPEFLYKHENGLILMNGIKSNGPYGFGDAFTLLPADYSQDSWSLGVLLYELYTGMSFFLKDNEDSIDDDSLQLLYDFDEDYKIKKLLKISDKLARNLVSLLLVKDPSKRLSMMRVLEHPFITGQSAPRLIGESAQFDVFISYRVSSDAHHAELLNNLLTAEGINVWWDKKSLEPGKNWEDGFSDGLVKSHILIPIMSKNSLNNPLDRRSNITLLEENSPCDNVMLEYELALEFQEREMLSLIYPVLIGDYDDNTNEYTDYFRCNSYPSNTKNIHVKSIDNNVKSHLNRLGLGSRLVEHDGLKSVIDKLLKCQGCIVKGLKDQAFNQVINDIKGIISNKI